MIDIVYSIIYSYYSGETEEERIKKAEEILGRKIENKKAPINIHETKGIKRVAVLPVIGVIGKRLNMFNDVSGGVSTELLKKDIQRVIDDPSIDATVLDMESPGGVIDGIRELAEYIFQMRDKKPIVAYANGEMASGALYIGAATDKITAFDTAEIGSIGVWVGHSDYSKFFEDLGIKNTIIRSTKFKAAVNKYEPLTSDIKEYVQEIVDHYAEMFVEDLAKYRNTDIEKVNKEWANGKMFPARKALDIGLIDHIMTLEETIQMAADMSDDMEVRQAALAINDDPILRIEKISYENILQFNSKHSDCCD